MGTAALAAASLALVRPAPSYDPWSWLLWGGQIAGGDLSTVEGPAFKPLPVAVCAIFSLAGPAAPWLWAVVSRAGAVVGLGLAFRIGRRLAGGSVAAGLLAATGVALCGSYLGHAASGMAEGLLLALALGGVEAWRSGRHRAALACAVAAALLRVETWPFLVVAGAVVWRRRPQDRPLLMAVAALVPGAWFLPELVGSGDLLRSAARAQVPNPGQPALADVPALASLHAAVALPPWPLWVGVGLAARHAWSSRARRSPRPRRSDAAVLVPAAVGLAWIGLVAAMAQAGFSGEPRYSLTGATLVAISGAAGLSLSLQRLSLQRASRRASARRAPAAVTVVTAMAAAFAGTVTAATPGLVEAARIPQVQAYQWGLQSDLAETVARVGGTEAVLVCGQPYVGPYRGPLIAHHLGLPRHRVEPDRPPQSPGVVFRSALTPGAAPAPAVPPGFREVLRNGRWQVFARCRPAGSAEVAGAARARTGEGQELEAVGDHVDHSLGPLEGAPHQ